MSLAVLIASVLSAAPGGPIVPGDGLGLAPPPPPPAAAAPSSPAAPTVPPLGVGGILAVAGTLVGVAGSRRRDPSGSPPPFPPDVLVVFVPGFGSAPTGTFDDLIGGIGVPADQVREFDWRWVVAGAGHEAASRRGEIDNAADVLEAYLAGLSADDRGIYLIGHSKGGATIAELMARWDADPERAITGVYGAALLDPPLSGGLLGELQRVGKWLPFLPNNGGYDPHECGWLTCRDTRRNLGREAGVDVLVIRNQDAVVTSFGDEPAGLRIYDLDDDGEPSALRRVVTRGSVLGRISSAHDSPLHHPEVAACLRNELHAVGTCRWSAGATHGVRLRGGRRRLLKPRRPGMFKVLP